MKVILHNGQLQVAKDQHRFRIVCAGRRWGKSVLSQLIILQWALKQSGLYWIVSPTYRQGKEIHWRGLQRILAKTNLLIKKNEVELSLTLRNGSIIELKGAENPDALRGSAIRGLVIDEIASIRNWDWLWKEVLEGVITDYQAPCLFISTPKGFNHFYDLFEDGQAKPDQGDYKSWRFTSYENTTIKGLNEELERKKKDLTKDTFAQEYLADFTRTTGIAHKPWRRALHLIPLFEIPTEWGIGRGFDYGSAHPTASCRIRIDTDDNWYVDLCYKDSRRSIEQHAQAILAQDYGLGTVVSFGDPSGAQWFTEFSKYNLYIQPANKEVGQGMRGWVEHCVEVVNQRLKPVPGHTIRLPNGAVINDAPRLFVLEKAENKEFVTEIENLKWRETATGEIVPVLDESDDKHGHYDLMAALRYFAVSYEKPEPPYKPPKDDITLKNWSLS